MIDDSIKFYKGEDLIKILKDVRDDKIEIDAIIDNLEDQREHIHYCGSTCHVWPYVMMNCGTRVGTPGLYITPITSLYSLYTNWTR